MLRGNPEKCTEEIFASLSSYGGQWAGLKAKRGSAKGTSAPQRYGDGTLLPRKLGQGPKQHTHVSLKCPFKKSQFGIPLHDTSTFSYNSFTPPPNPQVRRLSGRGVARDFPPPPQHLVVLPCRSSPSPTADPHWGWPVCACRAGRGAMLGSGPPLPRYPRVHVIPICIGWISSSSK